VSCDLISVVYSHLNGGVYHGEERRRVGVARLASHKFGSNVVSAGDILYMTSEVQ
jgi:hypothetical protein